MMQNVVPKKLPPAIIQEPLTLAAARPQAGFPMKVAQWNKLKRLLRRIRIGHTDWWKDIGLVFFGSFITLLPQAITDMQSPPQNHLSFTLSIVMAMITLLITGCRVLGYLSSRGTETASLSTVLEEMDDIEAQYLDMGEKS